MVRMATLESRIDDLYRLPLGEFVAARAALAREVKGADAQRVKGLKKPTVVPWSVNQVYWHERATFDRLQRAGTELRRAQIAALQGKPSDVRAATDAHRKAVSSAVEQAVRLAGNGDAHPGTDALARTFEAISLAPTPPEPLGRLTQPLQPGGFEMLAGVDVPRAMKLAATHRAGEAVPTHRVAERSPSDRAGDGLQAVPGTNVQTVRPRSAKERARQRLAVKAERERQRDAMAAARRREKAIKTAAAEVERAQKREAQAAEAWKRAKDDLEKAKRALADLQPSS
jgi:hypothetical protein